MLVGGQHSSCSEPQPPSRSKGHLLHAGARGHLSRRPIHQHTGRDPWLQQVKPCMACFWQSHRKPVPHVPWPHPRRPVACEGEAGKKEPQQRVCCVFTEVESVPCTVRNILERGSRPPQPTTCKSSSSTPRAELGSSRRWHASCRLRAETPNDSFEKLRSPTCCKSPFRPPLPSRMTQNIRSVLHCFVLQCSVNFTLLQDAAKNRQKHCNFHTAKTQFSKQCKNAIPV